MSESSFFTNDWMETQRKYWDSWIAMNRKALGQAGESQTAPWGAALDHWWKAVSPAAPDASKQLMERMMDQGKAFFRMAEALMPGAGQDGLTSFNKTLDEMQKSFGGMLTGESGNIHRMLAFWELPYDNWQRMVSTLSPIPGDFLRNMPHDSVKEHVDRLLSAPGLGYTREEQGAYQELMRCALDYQKALREYLAFYAQLGTKAIERLRSHTQKLIADGKTIDSARAIYNDWVDCCEAVYAEEVGTPAYAQLHGDMINAQMLFKHRLSVMVDENLGALNMPTRAEVRTLQDRLQETRRENKKLSSAVRVLQRQVEALISGKPVPEGRALTHGAPRAALIAGPSADKSAASKKTTAKPAAK